MHNIFSSMSWLPFHPGATLASLMIWTVLMIGFVGLVMSLFKR